MIAEDYVSYETAKLLKEKGFDWKCKTVKFYPEPDYDQESPDGISAPTLQMAMKWLREEHNLFIGIHPRLSLTDYYWITADIYRVRKKNSSYHIGEVDDYNCVACCDGTSFDDACEAAIKYCLEKLI